MLRARCTSAGIRMSYPRCLNNMYTADEVQDFEQLEDNEIIEEVEVSSYESRFLANKAILSTKLRKYDFSDAMIKEFATVNDLINNKVLIDELVNDDAKLIELIKEFEK